MQTSTSKLTRKCQATVPAAVRKQLKLKAGDLVTFEIDHERVQLRKATPLDVEFSSALVPTLSEWDSPNDEEAYRDL